MSQRVGMPFEQRYIAGEVVTGFRDRLANMISKNEGIRQFSILTNTAYNADVPFADTQQTRIRITNSQHDISQLDKTYITAEFEATISLKNITLTGKGTGANAGSPIIKFFRLQNNNLSQKLTMSIFTIFVPFFTIFQKSGLK